MPISLLEVCSNGKNITLDNLNVSVVFPLTIYPLNPILQVVPHLGNIDVYNWSMTVLRMTGPFDERNLVNMRADFRLARSNSKARMGTGKLISPHYHPT